MDARVVVDPQGRDGGRRVRVDAETLGIAYRPEDVLEFLRRSGLEDVDQIDLANTPLIDWHGGGPAAWD
ncbi:hypothetical protein [Streptomyces sp. NBC_01198]|uniref:hypothetical protein n=1 Tax=Streptomyces sp. NBC_01198 TaxID=2903769 RepID=UPI002E139A08|nr:hypothetical protein OG702_25470 [Streptomyces sp. NBC_01198]